MTYFIIAFIGMLKLNFPVYTVALILGFIHMGTSIGFMFKHSTQKAVSDE